MMLSHTDGVNSNFSLQGSSFEANAKRNEFLSMTIFPHLQPTWEPNEYPMAEYDSWKWDCKMSLFHFKWNLRMLTSYIPGKPHWTLVLLLNIAEAPRRSLLVLMKWQPYIRCSLIPIGNQEFLPSETFFTSVHTNHCVISSVTILIPRNTCLFQVS